MKQDDRSNAKTPLQVSYYKLGIQNSMSMSWIKFLLPNIIFYGFTIVKTRIAMTMSKLYCDPFAITGLKNGKKNTIQVSYYKAGRQNSTCL